MARQCPDAPAGSNDCFNCGQSGYVLSLHIIGIFHLMLSSHKKADCPNPKVEREFTGECRLCNESGHRAADCPTKPPVKCMNCKEEGQLYLQEEQRLIHAGLLTRKSGHVPKDCTKNRVFDLSDIADATVEVAWDNLLKADAEKDLDEIRAVSEPLSSHSSFTHVITGCQSVLQSASNHYL